MTWDEIQTEVVARLKAQPRGFQIQLAERLGRNQSQVAHWFTGRRPVPTDVFAQVAREVGLELMAVPIQVSSKTAVSIMVKKFSVERMQTLQQIQTKAPFDAVAILREGRDRM